jgi:hypothetical protein
MTYEYRIENMEVIESIVVDLWKKETTIYRRWQIDVLTSHIDYVIKHKDNRDSIIRCRKWLFDNYLELFI